MASKIVDGLPDFRQAVILWASTIFNWCLRVNIAVHTFPALPQRESEVLHVPDVLVGPTQVNIECKEACCWSCGRDRYDKTIVFGAPTYDFSSVCVSGLLSSSLS